MIRSVMHLAATIYVQLFAPLAAATFLGAIWRGGKSEVLIGGMFVVATDLQKIAEHALASAYTAFDPIIAVTDASLFAVLLLIALRDPRVWILCATALQLVVSLAHVGKIMRPDISPLAYAILLGSGGYPSQLLLIIGILQSSRKRPPIATS